MGDFLVGKVLWELVLLINQRVGKLSLTPYQMLAPVLARGKNGLQPKPYGLWSVNFGYNLSYFLSHLA